MTPNLTYRPDIDGLRAVAVLAVVLHHLSASLVPGGYVGVDVFFVISGYLITSIISREMAQGRFSFARFYERRARRIFPALFAVLAVTLLAGYFLLLPSDYVSTLRGALGTLFFASNIVFWRDMAAGYFAATDAGLNPLLHTWSLAVEEQFYVFFPVLLLLCYRYFRRHSSRLASPPPVIASEARQSRGHGSPRPFGSRDDDAGAVIAIAASHSLLAMTEARQSMPPPPSPVNQVYNVAVGDRTTLNELYAQLHRNLLPRYPHLQGTQPVYRDFRAGDVRHSLADISKAATRLGYAPTQHIGQGLELAMPWYVQHTAVSA